MKETKYKKAEELRQIQMVESDTPNQVFNHAQNGGFASWIESNCLHRLPSRKVLKDNSKNFLSSIYCDVLNYFRQHKIAWWHMQGDPSDVPTGHIMSSQIQCLNHLFGIRNNERAIKSILLNATGIAFDQILTTLDNDGLIEFEFTYKNKELLGEDDAGAQRGAYCTSVDAMIRAQKDNKVYLIPIEWKYTEAYEGYDLTCDTRIKRYQHLIEKSEQLKVPKEGVPHSIYMKEPQYELMRQTLFVEQMIRKGIADYFFHINIIPNKNEDLRQSVEQNFIPMLNNPDIFCCIDPSDFFKPLTVAPFINDPQLRIIIEYLRKRYWE